MRTTSGPGEGRRTLCRPALEAGFAHMRSRSAHGCFPSPGPMPLRGRRFAPPAVPPRTRSQSLFSSAVQNRRAASEKRNACPLRAWVRVVRCTSLRVWPLSCLTRHCWGRKAPAPPLPRGRLWPLTTSHALRAARMTSGHNPIYCFALVKKGFTLRG